MSFKNIVRELRELKDGIGSRSRRGEGSNWRVRTRSHVVPDQTPNECVNVEQSPWANLPPELLLDIIQRVEESEATWPARAAVVCCAAVCRSWREITKEVVQNPEKCGRFTFPISLKQPGPRDSPIQCYIRRDRATSTYLLFYGLAPCLLDTDKLRTTLYALDEITKKIPSSGDQKLLFFASFSAFRSAKLGIFFVISSSAYNVVIDLSVSSRPTLLSGQSSLKKKGYLRCSSLYVGMVYKLSISMLCSVAIFGSEDHSDKLLLASRKTRRATCTDFVISLSTENFSRASDKYVGKLRSNFLGTKFTVYDSQPPSDSAAIQCARPSRRFHSRQVLPRVPACNYSIGTITYELNVLRTRGPRKMHCVMHSIPVSSIQEGGSVPTPSSFMHSYEQLFSPVAHVKVKESVTAPCSPSIPATPIVTTGLGEPLNLKNKSPRWHEQLQCWCLNFRGRVTVASVKNFQLVAEVDASHNVTPEEQERVILQFGKIGKDIFTMDYRYPLSAFQAFAICLSSFDTKPACE